MKKTTNPSGAGGDESSGSEGLDPRLQTLSESLKIHKVFNEEISLHMKQFVKLLDDLVSESTVISVEYQKYSEQLSDQDFSVSSKDHFIKKPRSKTKIHFHLNRKEC